MFFLYTHIQLMYAPRIYCAVDIPKKNRNYKTERYRACTEGLNCQHIWIRQPDFTCNTSFGKSSCVCLKLQQGSSYTQPLKSLPLWAEIGDVTQLHIQAVPQNSYCIELHPLLDIPSEIPVSYEILFQLNSLVHMHKLPPKAVNLILLQTLNGLPLELCTKILQRMHKLNSICYNPVQFVKSQLAEIVKGNGAKSNAGRNEKKLMKCHRVLITPSKIYLQVHLHLVLLVPFCY
jgi:RNA-dependent RNA polymerase